MTEEQIKQEEEAKLKTESDAAIAIDLDSN